MVNTHMEEEITEEWKTKKYYSKYTISNLGRVKHIARDEIIKGSINGDGYIQVSLYPDNNEIGLEKKPLRLHRLVAELFCSNDSPEKKNIVNHLNSDKLDNRSINLEWTTNLENTRPGNHDISCHSWSDLEQNYKNNYIKINNKVIAFIIFDYYYIILNYIYKCKCNLKT